MPIDSNHTYEVMWGRTSADMNPGLADTVLQVQRGLTESSAANAEYMAEAHAFITEYGAAVIGGHAAVNMPPADSPILGGSGELYDAG